MSDVEFRYVLEPTDGGYRIRRIYLDEDFQPPMWCEGAYLNEGRKFPNRAAAREYMLSEVER